MQKASFSIKDYLFDQVEINLEFFQERDLKIDFTPEGIYDNQKQIFELTFVVTVSNSLKESPFVKIRCKGFFTFENVNTFEEIPDFFYRNSIAILFPYIRAYISLVTTQANVPGIILPTYNLSGLENQLREHTTQK
ncbi:protein-export chaperone SecB [Capnocytophaga canimorsus]|uniref:protein-export chaperone SecB n=1 Tax=Capnocytophaga canimorsus TaxID=28188 RepID=UPI0037D04E12